MPRKIGLGRGLDALLDNNDGRAAVEEKLQPAGGESAQLKQRAPQSIPLVHSPQHSSGQDIVQLPVDKLTANPGQPRKNFDEAELQELAGSIKTYGIIQPIIAANAGDGSYIIIAGERRTRAAKLAGLDAVPVIIRDYTDQKRLEISLIENIQRSDLNPIEEAAAYKNLMDFSKLSHDELAARIGKNRSTVANALRLLKLPVEIQKSIEEGKVTSGHARSLLSVADAREREKLYREILSNNISVREAEKRAAAAGKTAGAKKSAKDAKRLADIDAMTEKFIEKLGTKVVIEGDLSKGRILIDYYSMDDLKRLYEILGGDNSGSC